MTQDYFYSFGTDLSSSLGISLLLCGFVKLQDMIG